MAKARSLVGLDVHATKIVAAVLDADTGELGMFVLNGENAGAAALCAGLPRPVRAAYEAGPTGYTLARELAKRGIECVVAAPSKIPRATGDKVKNDCRDAEHLVRLLLAGKLHPVRVPGPRRRGAARSRSRPGDTAPGSDASATPLVEDADASWSPVRRRASVDRSPSEVAKDGVLGLAGGADDVAGPGGRDRRAGPPPRSPRARDRRDPARLAVGDAGRPAAVFARGRHTHRGRAVRRGRRLRTIRQARAADELSRLGALESQRRGTVAGWDRSPRPD